MNSSFPLVPILGLFFFLNLPLSANDLVKYPSGSAAWTVEVHGSPDANVTLIGTDIVKVEVAQNENVSSNLVTYASGGSRVTWGVTGTNLVLTEDPHGAAFLVPSSHVFFIPYLASIFDWLSPELLVEKKPIFYQGKSCFHYKQKNPIANAEGKVVGTQTNEAWIDSKTLLPVALDNGHELAVFTFHPPPQSPLVMPEKFKKILDGYTAVMGIHRSQ